MIMYFKNKINFLIHLIGSKFKIPLYSTKSRFIKKTKSLILSETVLQLQNYTKYKGFSKLLIANLNLIASLHLQEP